MKKNIISFLIFFCLCGASFAKATSDRPEWVDNWRSIYPDEVYIAQMGKANGKKADNEAKNIAANTLAQFIKTNVQSETNSSMETTSASDEKGRLVTSKRKTNSQNITLSVDVVLTSLEFTEPWYNKKEKSWYCVAYISREKAYQAYKPAVQDAYRKFQALYEKAENETEPLLKCNYYKAAFNSGADFRSTYDFAILLNPTAVKMDFESERSKLNSIPAVVKKILLQSTVSINVNGDYGNSNYDAILKVFSGMGFVIQEEDSLYKLEAVMNDNDSVYKFKTRETHSIYPSISITLKNKDGVPVYAFSYKTDVKTSNFTLDSARRDAYPKFAREMAPNLSSDFEEHFGLNDLDILFGGR